jgi:hypothetical protein
MDKNEYDDYAAKEQLQSVLSNALSNSKKTNDVSYPLCFRSLLSATVFIMLVSAVTALAVVSTYYSIFMR